MNPSISYPDATAKVRVITLQDQSEPTVKTLHKANAYHPNSSEYLSSINHITPEKKLITNYNTLTDFRAFLCAAQTLEQADTGNEIKLIHTGPFRDFITCMSAAGKAS